MKIHFHFSDDEFQLFANINVVLPCHSGIGDWRRSLFVSCVTIVRVLLTGHLQEQEQNEWQNGHRHWLHFRHRQGNSQKSLPAWRASHYGLSQRRKCQ